MGIIRLIGQILKIAMFLLNLRSEGDKKKAEEKAEVGKKVIDAFKETNPKRRDSFIVGAIDDINRL
jgi:hypothetical protein